MYVFERTYLVIALRCTVPSDRFSSWKEKRGAALSVSISRRRDPISSAMGSVDCNGVWVVDEREG